MAESQFSSENKAEKMKGYRRNEDTSSRRRKVVFQSDRRELLAALLQVSPHVFSNGQDEFHPREQRQVQR